jgi:hypothetical protein
MPTPSAALRAEPPATRSIHRHLLPPTPSLRSGAAGREQHGPRQIRCAHLSRSMQAPSAASLRSCGCPCPSPRHDAAARLCRGSGSALGSLPLTSPDLRHGAGIPRLRLVMSRVRSLVPPGLRPQRPPGPWAAPDHGAGLAPAPWTGAPLRGRVAWSGRRPPRLPSASRSGRGCGKTAFGLCLAPQCRSCLRCARTPSLRLPCRFFERHQARGQVLIEADPRSPF